MKKCKCSFETQTRAANPHIPSSDKNQKVSIRDLWDRGKIRIRDRALRNGTLENPSQCEGFETKGKERETFCGCFGKRTPFLRGRVQLLGCEQKRLANIHSVNIRWRFELCRKRLEKSCKILHSAKDLGVGIANNVERFLYRTYWNEFPALLTFYIRKQNFKDVPPI